MVGVASRLLKAYAEYGALAEHAKAREAVLWGRVDLEFKRRVALCWAKRGTEASQGESHG